MDYTNLFLQVVGAIITILGAVLTYYLVPLLKTKLGKDKYASILSMVTIAVKSAEQIFRESGQGEKKKAYVIDFLKKQGVNLSEEQLNALIESAVLQLNKALK